MTLQSAYFEEFKDGPKVLLWGDAAGMRKLSDLLRDLHRAPDFRPLSTICQSVDGKEIAIKVSSHATGMHFNRETLEWNLSSTLADDFAELVEVLTTATNGHQYLDCGDGITVMVSVGEYPANLRP
jgi:hypothetical protein